MERSLSEPLGEEELASLAAHLDECEVCRTRAGAGPPQAALQADLARAETVRSEASVDVTVPLARLNELLGGEYEIIGEIGRGGMGIVYQARQIELDRMVALKVLPALLGLVRPDAMARFRREASLAARLKHTNIIAVHDFGQVEGTLYYAMELIEGRSLREILREINETGAIEAVLEAGSSASLGSPAVGSQRSAVSEGEATRQRGSEATGDVGRRVSDVGEERAEHDAGSAASTPKPPLTRLGSSSASDRAYYRRVAGWVADVADALDYAHGLGVIHRDVKPSNLLLAPDGRMMISDFGLARASGVESLTATRSLLGTARYMSPEQADESMGALDRRADVYGLGSTLYELLAFRPMFAAADDREVLDSVLNKEPAPPRRFVRQVPRELETICLKAVEKDREARYTTAKAMADDLRRWLLDLPIHARRPSLAVRAAKLVRRRKLLTALGASLLIVLVSSGFLLSGYHASHREAAAAKVAADCRAAQVLFFEADVEFYQHGRYDAALAKVDEGLALAPDSRGLRRLRGAILRHMGRYDEAVACLQELVDRHPDYWLGHYFLAAAYADMGNDTKAEFHRSVVQRLNPDSAEALRVQAEEEDDPQEALALLNRAIELEPDRADHLLARYWRLRELGRYDEMLRDIQQVAGAYPNWAFVQSERGLALFRLGRYQEAEDAYGRAIELDPDDALGWFNRAVSKVKTGRFAPALADVNEAIRLDREYAPAYLCQAKAQVGLGNMDGAIEDIDRAIELEPTFMEAYAERSFLHGQAGRWGDVIADGSRMIQLDPQDPRGYADRGLAYMRLGQYERAIADFTRYIQLRPDDEKGYKSRGAACAHQGQYAEAIRDFTKGIELRPDVATDYRNRSLCYLRTGQFADAAADLTRVLEFGPDNGAALLQRGMAHELAGEHRLALTDYEQAALAGGPSEAYATLWRHILLRQNGRESEAASLLASRASAVESRTWIDRLYDLFGGELTPEDLLAAAVTDDERAEAYYYIGHKALLDSRPDDAREAFAQCAALDRNDILETDFARALLKQLDEHSQPLQAAP